MTGRTVADLSETARARLFWVLALRDDYEPGVCCAWMESAERVCRRPESADTPNLCARHAKVALSKLDREIERRKGRA